MKLISTLIGGGEAKERPGWPTALCQSQSFLQFIKRCSFPLVSRSTYKSVSVTKQELTKHRQVSKEKSCRGSNVLLADTGQSSTAGKDGQVEILGLLAKMPERGPFPFVVNQINWRPKQSPLWPPAFCQCLQKWLIHNVSMQQTYFLSPLFSYSPSQCPQINTEGTSGYWIVTLFWVLLFKKY